MNDQQRWVEHVRWAWGQEAERAGVADWRELSSGILLHIAASTPTPRFVASAPETPGEVRFSVEVVPFHPGANGEEYHSGRLPAADAARALRDAAGRCEREWGADQVEMAYTEPAMDEATLRKREAAERAKREAYERREATR